MTRANLLIYAKTPRMGVSKTRLAAGLGTTKARRIAHMTLSRTLRAALQSGCQATLYVAPDSALSERLGGLSPSEMARMSQGRGSLTERLSKGFREMPNGPLLFIGADAPDLSAALLRQAERALRRNDAVFGPASDGGFWLFGLNKRCRTRAPFDKVRWSGPHAMDDVRTALPKGTKVAFLEKLIDLDEANDWEHWQRQRSAG